MRYQAYPEYKESNLQWIDEVPSKWKVIKLKFVCSFKTGWTPPTKMAEYFSGDNTWVTIADIKSKEVITSELSLTNEAIDDFNMELVPKGSLLYSFKLSVGKVAFAGKDLYTNEAIFSVLPNADYIISFLYYLFPISVIQNASVNIYGAKILNQELIKSSYLLMPELEEQEKIADFLDYKTQQIDLLIEKKKALIENLNEQRIAVITQAVTKGLDKNSKMKPSGVDWLGDVPEHWDVVKLRFLVTQNLTNGIFKKAVDWGTGCRVVNVFDVYVHNDIIDESLLDRLECDEKEQEKFSAKHGDFFLVRSSLKLEGVGKSASVIDPEDEIVFECHLVRGRPDLEKVHPRYLNLFLNSKYARDYLVSRANVVTMATIDQSKFKGLVVSLPKYDEQKNIAKLVDSKLVHIDSMVNTAIKVIERLHEYQSSLITAAVTGKIDVRDIKIGKDAT